MQDKINGEVIRALRNGCPSCEFGKGPEYKPYALYRHSDGTITDRYRNVHTCEAPSPRKFPERTPEPAPEPVRVPEPAPEPVRATPAPSADADKLGALSALLDALAPKVDASQVRDIIDAELAKRIMPVVVDVRQANGDVKRVEGATHKALPNVLTDLSAGEHVLMVGPAGTGKSTIASQCAEAMGIKYYSISLSPQTPASALLGYMQAAGEYVRSLYREAYEHGGVFHFDEFDNAHPSVLAVINASLANGHMAFADKMVKRHADFRCVASANTYGRGADRQYVGRQAIDAATLDRFSVETVEVDDALEESMCMSTGLEPSKVTEVLKYVRALRKRAADEKMTLIFSPRASFGACRLLKAGRKLPDVVNARIRRGVSDADWSKVTRGIPSPIV